MDAELFSVSNIGSERSAPVQPLALFEILIRENADSLTAFLRASLADRASVDDLFQETMLVAWRRIADYDATRPFGAWLRGIARRLILARRRETAREVLISDERLLDLLDRRMSQLEHCPGDTLTDKLAALAECVDQLAPHYREPIRMHYQLKKTADWLAAHLRSTRDAIQKRLQRARLQLAECLQRKGVFAAAE